MKKFLIAASIVLSTSAFAGACTTHDAWTGPDKTKHFIAGGAIGSAGTLVFKNPDYGFALGVGVGALKEVVDRMSSNHTCSFQDFAVTALGAGAGAYGTAWIITPRFIGFSKAL